MLRTFVNRTTVRLSMPSTRARERAHQSGLAQLGNEVLAVLCCLRPNEMRALARRYALHGSVRTEAQKLQPPESPTEVKHFATRACRGESEPLSVGKCRAER